MFFGLTDTSLSETRVIGRVKEGGHYVDPITVSANFYGNLEKLDKYFDIFNTVTIMDTSGVEYTGLALIENGEPKSSVIFEELPDWFKNNLINITSFIVRKEK